VAEKRKKPDIEFGATIKAKEMRFREVPETKVEFFGNPDHESGHGDRRENLPDEVEPNKTYKDVRVDYRLASRLVYDDEDKEEGSG
jgi:hypothetical protein